MQVTPVIQVTPCVREVVSVCVVCIAWTESNQQVPSVG